VALHAKKSSGGGSRDMSKEKCFACHKTGHSANQCPNKKKKEAQVAASPYTETDEFAKKFKEEFSLIAFLSSSSFAEWRTLGHGSWTVDHLSI
jgi:hypothetical protein